MSYPLLPRLLSDLSAILAAISADLPPDGVHDLALSYLLANRSPILHFMAELYALPPSRRASVVSNHGALDDSVISPDFRLLAEMSVTGPASSAWLGLFELRPMHVSTTLRALDTASFLCRPVSGHLLLSPFPAFLDSLCLSRPAASPQMR